MSIEKLPKDINSLLMMYLPIANLINMAQVSKKWRRYAILELQRRLVPSNVNLRNQQPVSLLDDLFNKTYEDKIRNLTLSIFELQLQLDRTNVDQLNQQPVPPLCIAWRYRDMEVVQLLLERGANIKEMSGEAIHLLEFAFKNGHIPIVRLLMSRGLRSLHVFCQACEEGKSKNLELLLPGLSGDDVKVALSNAIHFGSDNFLLVIKLLIERITSKRVFEVNVLIDTFRLACDLGHVEVVKLFIPVVKRYNKDDTALTMGICTARKKNRIQIAKLLILSYYPDISTAIVESCKKYPDVVKLLVEENPAHVDGAFVMAYTYEPIRVVKVLIDNASSINGVNVSQLLDAIPGSERVWNPFYTKPKNQLISTLLIYYISSLNNPSRYSYFLSFFVVDKLPAAECLLRFIQDPTYEPFFKALSEFDTLFKNKQEPLGMLYALNDLFVPQELKLKLEVSSDENHP